MSFPGRAKFTSSKGRKSFRFSPDNVRYTLIICALIALLMNIFGLYPSAEFDFISYTLSYVILGAVLFFITKYRAEAGEKWERRVYYLIFLIFVTLSNISGGIHSPLKWGAVISAAALMARGGNAHASVMIALLFFAFIKKAASFTAADYAMFAVFAAFPLFAAAGTGMKKAVTGENAKIIQPESGKESSDFGVIAHDLLAKLLRAYRPLLGASSLVFLVKKEGDEYGYRTMLYDCAAGLRFDPLYEINDRDDIIGAALKKGGFFMLDAGGLRVPYYTAKEDAAAVAVCPVMTAKMLGAIAADFREQPSDKEQLGARMKNLAAEILDILSLFEINAKVLDREKRVSILYEIYGRLNLVEGREKMLAEFFNAIRAFDVYSGYIAYYNADEKEFETGESFNYPKSLNKIKLKASGDEMLKYLLSGEGSSLVTDTARRNIPLNFRRANIDSFFISLLKNGNNTYGLIKLDKEKGYSFSDFEIKTIKMLLTRVVLLLENAALYEKIRKQATEDGLTGLCNHLTFQERLRLAVEKKSETGQPRVALALTDIDHFKKFNDTFGHQEGDNVLKKVAAMLKKFTDENPGTFAARYGGEEFVVVFEKHTLTEAVKIADKIRKYSEDNLRGGNETEKRPITMSVGVSSYPDYSDSPRALIKNADEALYLAKQEGRNTVRTTVEVRTTDRRKNT